MLHCFSSVQQIYELVTQYMYLANCSEMANTNDGSVSPEEAISFIFKNSQIIVKYLFEISKNSN